MRPHPHLIEISTWPWLERLSARAGRNITLADVPASAWDAFAASGFDIVYLMGVWRRSPLGRRLARTDLSLLPAYDRALPGWSMRDVPGSPYCVHAYEPDDRMGGWRGLDRARDELARRNIALLLDFVPNHTALDHEWVATRPDLYVAGTLDDYRRDPGAFHPIDDANGVRFIANARDPNFPPWQDVAQLNYFNPVTRDAMLEQLAAISDHCDGVRCDMAMLVLNDVFARTWADLDLLWEPPAEEFWPMAIDRVSSLAFVAEVYWDREHTLQEQGFDFTYDKRLLDRLRTGDAADVRAHLAADASYANRLARFLENHDEPRSAAVFGSRLPAAAAMAFTLPGLRFFFDGQMDGFDVQSPVQLGRWLREDGDRDVKMFYSRLVPALNRDLFHSGAWSLIDAHDTGDGTSASLVAYAWRRDRELAVVAANPGPAESQALLALGALPWGASFDFVDQLTGQRYPWSRDDLQQGLYVRLQPGTAHLFLVEAKA